MDAKKIRHISIIMDGNGRWANDRNLPRAFGHKEGIKSIKKIVEACTVRQISTLTLFAFSSENWNRPNYEIKLLMNLFEDSITTNSEELHSNNVKVKFIGNLSKFDKQLIDKISELELLTKDNTGLLLNFAINYGGKWDIINAFNKYISSIDASEKDMKIDINDIEKYLSLKDNYPDLLIRTGGEHRLSNFMLWQHAYTELYFTDCLWPDFDVSELDEAIKWFQERDRKFGAIKNIKTSSKNNA
ncbi:MAG: di-trans,poly-cis-decaprenylcistransferase [Gammaproteobacteria bacterium]|nr:di-trans,poly-cis-decaprenylcistransferase [Gammaproteobacteria bacterium]